MAEARPDAARRGRSARGGRVLALAGGIMLVLGASLLQARVEAPTATPPLALPGSDDCTVCHEPGRRGPRRADTPPCFDAAALHASPHAGLECRDCHADLAGKELPHESKLQRVDCGGCHADEASQHTESRHG